MPSHHDEGCGCGAQVAEVVSTTEYQLRLKDLQAREAKESAAALAADSRARVQAALDSLLQVCRCRTLTPPLPHPSALPPPCAHTRAGPVSRKRGSC